MVRSGALTKVAHLLVRTWQTAKRGKKDSDERLAEMSMAIFRLPLRLAMSTVHALMRASWFVRRPSTFGAHAAALTPAGKLILVKLRYAAGWRLPGGGIKAGEDQREAVLRELREEIGMIFHGEVKAACDIPERVDFKHDTASLFIVRDVEYRPRWSLEIEAVIEAALDKLPDDLSPRTAKWLAALRL